jgi:hypothetical protein
MKTNLIVIASLLLVGCNRYNYYPTFQSIPTQSEAKEVKAAYFISEANQGFAVNYTLTKNTGVFTTVNTFGEYDFKNDAHLLDVGAFYFNTIDFSGDKYLSYAVSGAYGFGENNRNSEYYAMDIMRLSLQPSVIFRSKFFDAGLSTRFSHVGYNVERVANVHDREFEALRDMESSKYFFAEPNAFVGVGYKGIKLNLHLTQALKLNNADLYYLDSPQLYMSLSANYKLSKLFGKE